MMGGFQKPQPLLNHSHLMTSHEALPRDVKNSILKKKKF